MADFSYDAIPVEDYTKQPKRGFSIVAYAFTVNFILGAGVLGLPYNFVVAGNVLSVVYLIFVSFIAYITILFLVEVVARGDAWSRFHSSLSNTPLDYGTVNYKERLINTIPKLEITGLQIEVNELCKLFVGNWFGRIYEVSITCYVYGSLWLYGTIFASSITSAIYTYCDIQQKSLSEQPAECANSYRICILIYAVISITLTLVGMKSQKLLQVGLTSLAMVGILTMTITSLYDLEHTPHEAGTNATAPFFGGRCSDIRDQYIHDRSACKTANFQWLDQPGLIEFGGFSTLCTAAMFSQTCHYGIPGLIQLVQDKKQITKIFFAGITTTMLLYSVLGISTSLYYGGSIEKLVNLNWRHYRTPAVKYFILIFPSILVIAAYPLNAIALASNLRGNAPKHWSEKTVYVATSLLASCPSLIAATFMTDVSKILLITGMFAFILTFWAPCILFLKSKKICIETWGADCTHTEYTTFLTRHNCFAYAILVLTSGFFVVAVYTAILSLEKAN